MLGKAEEAKEVIRSRKSKDTHYIWQNKEDKRSNNDLQTKLSTKTNDRATRTPLKCGGQPQCSKSVRGSCSTRGICRVTLVTNPVINHEWKKDRIVI